MFNQNACRQQKFYYCQNDTCRKVNPPWANIKPLKIDDLKNELNIGSNELKPYTRANSSVFIYSSVFVLKRKNCDQVVCYVLGCLHVKLKYCICVLSIFSFTLQERKIFLRFTKISRKVAIYGNKTVYIDKKFHLIVFTMKTEKSFSLYIPFSKRCVFINIWPQNGIIFQLCV